MFYIFFVDIHRNRNQGQFESLFLRHCFCDCRRGSFETEHGAPRVTTQVEAITRAGSVPHTTARIRLPSRTIEPPGRVQQQVCRHANVSGAFISICPSSLCYRPNLILILVILLDVQINLIMF